MGKAACTVCGNQVKWKGSAACSRECSNVLKKKKAYESRSCLECDKEFEIRKKLPNKLCSDVCRKKWNTREENKTSRIEKGREAYKKKTGYSSIFEDPEKKNEISQKAKKGIEKIGKEEFSRRSKTTKKERYGDENYNNQKQIRKTKEERYEDENYNNRDAAKSTSKERFGVDHAMKLKEFQNKAQDTLEERSGHRTPYQSPETMKKMQDSLIRKYGVKNVSQTEDVKQKVRDFYFSKFSDTVIYKQLETSSLELLDKYQGIRNIDNRNTYATYLFKCTDCDHEFTGTFSNHIVPTCRRCFPVYKSNKIHLELSEFLQSLGLSFEDNVRHIISPLELDFYFKDKKFAIEVDGNYYHSEIGGGKSRNYHLNKTEQCQEKGIHLIHIFEDEWVFKKDIVKSMLANAFRLNTSRIYARKCEVRPADKKEVKDFLDNNHIQGHCRFKHSYGLFHENELVSVLTVTPKKSAWEISRFCSKKGKVVVGGFSKLLSFLRKENESQNFVTYADCRYSGIDAEKTVYSKCGFEHVRTVKPRYWYFRKGDYYRRFHRFAFNKQVLIKNNKDIYQPWMTEWDIAKSIGMDRIWDCGNLVFEIGVDL